MVGYFNQRISIGQDLDCPTSHGDGKYFRCHDYCQHFLLQDNLYYILKEPVWRFIICTPSPPTAWIWISFFLISSGWLSKAQPTSVLIGDFSYWDSAQRQQGYAMFRRLKCTLSLLTFAKEIVPLVNQSRRNDKSFLTNQVRVQSFVSWGNGLNLSTNAFGNSQSTGVSTNSVAWNNQTYLDVKINLIEGPYGWFLSKLTLDGGNGKVKCLNPFRSYNCMKSNHYCRRTRVVVHLLQPTISIPIWALSFHRNCLQFPDIFCNSKHVKEYFMVYYLSSFELIQWQCRLKWVSYPKYLRAPKKTQVKGQGKEGPWRTPL